jgi:two-component system sensor histidine kinase KdpD
MIDYAGVVEGVAEVSASRRPAAWWPGTLPRARWISYAWGPVATAICTAISFPIGTRVDLINIVMVYMLGSAIAGLRLGRGASALTAVLNVMAFDYFFVPPRFSLAVYDASYLITFSAMLVVSVIITGLVIAVREQIEAAQARERHTAALLAIARDLSVTRDGRSMSQITVHRIAEELHCTSHILLCDEIGWVGFDPIPSSTESTLYLPLANSHGTAGVLVVDTAARALLPEQRRLLEGFARQLASALERVRLAEVAQEAHVAAERTAMRNTLLASISHDLRTPLSAIASAGSIVARGQFAMDAYRRATLGKLIEDKARDMSDLLSNVLDLVKLESGADVVNQDWHILGDIVGLAIQRNESRLAGWDVNTDIPDDLPMVSLDATLFVQLLSNLLENATKYTPPGTRIDISAAMDSTGVRIVLEDNGPGWGNKDPERLFEKFSRGQVESATGGVGLGLTICRAIARLHGGEIRARSNREGGARFEIAVPVPTEDARLEAAAAEA